MVEWRNQRFTNAAATADFLEWAQKNKYITEDQRQRWTNLNERSQNMYRPTMWLLTGTAFWKRVGIDLILVSSNAQDPSTLLNEISYGNIKMPKDWSERGDHEMEPMSKWIPLYKHLGK